MENKLCIKCNKNPIFIKKRELCLSCYQKTYHKRTSIPKLDREFDFVKNFFNHKNWIRHPVMFRLEGTIYTPDFYDSERNVFIEVAGTRQAYQANKSKYMMMEKLYPKIIFEVRQVSGKIIDINNPIDWDKDI